jgi:hypothetical protein
LNASSPPTNREPRAAHETIDRWGPLRRETVGEMSATYWSASGERAGREGVPTPGRNALPGVPHHEIPWGKAWLPEPHRANPPFGTIFIRR